MGYSTLRRWMSEDEKGGSKSKPATKASKAEVKKPEPAAKQVAPEPETGETISLQEKKSIGEPLPTETLSSPVEEEARSDSAEKQELPKASTVKAEPAADKAQTGACAPSKPAAPAKSDYQAQEKTAAAAPAASSANKTGQDFAPFPEALASLSRLQLVGRRTVLQMERAILRARIQRKSRK